MVKFLLLTEGYLFFEHSFEVNADNSQDYEIWREESRTSIARCETYFDILNRVGVAHECDRQTDGRTYRETDKTAFSNSAR